MWVRANLNCAQRPVIDYSSTNGHGQRRLTLRFPLKPDHFPVPVCALGYDECFALPVAVVRGKSAACAPDEIGLAETLAQGTDVVP